MGARAARRASARKSQSCAELGAERETTADQALIRAEPAAASMARCYLSPFGSDAGARSPACIDAGLKPEMAGHVEIDIDAVVPRPRSSRHADADPVVDRARGADQGAPGRAGGDVQAVDAERLAEPLEGVEHRRKKFATALASSSAWKPERLPEGRWKRMRDRISSCGRLGCEVIANVGWVAGPVTAMRAEMSVAVVSATDQGRESRRHETGLAPG